MSLGRQIQIVAVDLILSVDELLLHNDVGYRPKNELFVVIYDRLLLTDTYLYDSTNRL